MIQSRFFLFFGLLVSLGGFSQNSVLSSGTFYKIGTRQAGLYKIDYNFIQNTLGIDPGSLNTTNLKIYGNNQGVLPQLVSAERPQDLEELALYFVDGGDGTWDTEDFLLFWSDGPDHDETGAYLKNIYSDYAGFFLQTDSDTPGLRMAEIEGPAGEPILPHAHFTGVHENDLTNLLKSGRNWYGEFIPSQGLEYPLDLHDMVGNAQVSVEIISQSPGVSVDFQILTGSTVLAEDGLLATTSSSYGLKGRSNEFQFTVTPEMAPDVITPLTLSWSKGSEASLVIVDRISVSYPRSFSYNDAPYRFQLSDSSGAFVFEPTGEDLLLFAKSHGDQAQRVIPSGENGFSGYGGDSVTYEVLTVSDAATPEFLGAVANQNLHQPQSVDMLVITHESLLPAALDFQEYRMSEDSLEVEVVDIKEIYNEFSSGTKDITAVRDFIRYRYGDGASLKYVMLLGSASYDFKDILGYGLDLVPTYESYESLHNVQTYNSDDYFAFMDENEGEWLEGSSGNHLMDVSIGRVPARTLEEAEVFISKVKAYETSPDRFGAWRRRILGLADDGDGVLHMAQSDQIMDLCQALNPNVDASRLFIDDFPQQGAFWNQRTSESIVIRDHILDKFQEGYELFIYHGHGGEIGLTQEQVFMNEDVPLLANDKLPIGVMLTTEWSRFDDPEVTSGAMHMLFHTRGFVSVAGTTRPVYSASNFNLITTFTRAYYEDRSSEYRLGDVFNDTKNTSVVGVFNRNTTLLGDPSLRLFNPVYSVQLDQETLPEFVDALEPITLSGTIFGEDSMLVSGYNGALEYAIYAPAFRQNTLGDEGDSFEYTRKDDVLFKGRATIVNGSFDLSFKLPEATSIEALRISLYAYDSLTGAEAVGTYEDAVSWGGGIYPTEDEEAPEVQMSFTKIEGTEDYLLRAELMDSSGIFLSGQAPTGLSLELEERDVWMAPFFSAQPGNAVVGEISYVVRAGEVPTSEVVLKSCDNNANCTRDTVKIDLVSGLFEQESQEAMGWTLFPNPVISGEELYITTEAVEGPFRVELLDASGRKLYQSNPQASSSFSIPLPEVVPGSYILYLKGVDGQTAQARHILIH